MLEVHLLGLFCEKNLKKLSYDSSRCLCASRARLTATSSLLRALPLCCVLQLVSELATQSMEEGKLLSQQKEAAERFGFFQRTRNALSDLFGMLREKVRRSVLGSFFALW